MDLNPYRLTILGVVLVIVLGAGLVVLIGGAQTATPYLSLAGLAIPGLLALFRLERNNQKLSEFHSENQEQFAELRRALRESAPPNVFLVEGPIHESDPE